jgi:uncharacterized membrane protein
VPSFAIAAPAHPIFAHFTIALTVSSLAFDIASRALGMPSLSAAAWWCLVAATAATAGTLVSGLVSRIRAPIAAGPARSYVGWHMAIGPAFFGCLVALAVWRGSSWEANEMPSWIYLAVLSSAALLMTIQGYLGGELVYRFGVEVESRYAHLPVHDEAAQPKHAPRHRTVRR